MKLTIVKEGLQIGIPLLILSGIIAVFSFKIGVIILVLSLGIMAFFRDPQREPKVQDNQFISPADGKVVDITEVYEDKYLKTKVQRIGIFLSVFDVHINYAPCDGTVEFFEYNKGQFKNAMLKAASEVNENNFIGIAGKKTKLAIKQIAGLIARRVVFYPSKDSPIEAGKKIGLIKFSSRVEIFLPLDTKIHVKIGDKVKGALTILGEI